jgi:ABC-type multidrug transport system ATPase subunit
MSGVFRTLAASTKTLAQAMTLAGVMVLAIVIYTGFVITVPEMVVWFSWIRWINPVFYTFEALIANEFHGRRFTCSQFIPAYPSLTGDSFICAVRGAVAGERTVSGDAYIQTQYEYSYAHEWRNLGILIGFWIFFISIYLLASELNSSTSSKAEFLVFRRGHVPAHLKALQKAEGSTSSAEVRQEKKSEGDKETSAIPAQHDIFTWRNVCYDIPVKGGERRLLDHVSGWVKPGTLTALMGVSGAGKTTLLDVLAKRVSIGVVTGDMLVNGKALDTSFQRKTGYVQQQDLHLPTNTVREALRFSAMLRQPKTVSKKEKYAYVEEVIDMLGMQDFSDAIVGTPGEGLNVEQRKLLTIGVELAAKPALLIFLDEPTSGLDSQSSWAICAFLRKLAEHGQAVLSTIHQPSALLFQQFDRLLFLAKGGRTVYFGEIGDQSRTLLDYFEGNGARACTSQENVRPILDLHFILTNPKKSLPNTCLKSLVQVHLENQLKTGPRYGTKVNKPKTFKPRSTVFTTNELQPVQAKKANPRQESTQCHLPRSYGTSPTDPSRVSGANPPMSGQRSCWERCQGCLSASPSSSQTVLYKDSKMFCSALSC